VADARVGWVVEAARGKRQLTAVSLIRDGERRELDCDLLVVSGGEAPATALISQAGGRLRYDSVEGHFVVAELPPNVSVVGRVASGARAAPAAAAPCAATAAAAAPDGKAFACFCEDVTASDIRRSVREGYDSIELCKRFSTVTMGPCQGRMCQLSATRLVAAETGASLEALGITTARPPWSTVPLGVFAGRPFEPAKRSSIQSRHRALGASMRWAGDWRRPYDYGDPEGEALNVHERAGLIDVSTLGKLLVRGSEAGEFLDRLYPNRHSTLKPGRVRYGVLTSDAGRIIDDGTVTRLDDDTFYVTTTSSGAGAVEQWFAWWLADWRMEVRLTDVTQALAAVNLAGPRSREILTRLTAFDCGPEAFTYLDAKHARVAGVSALLLRIGFVGELGYEIHFPSAHGEHLWDAILRAGEPEGIRPFGLEPQRVLRLQKQHIIVGQDTDPESTPLGAGMPWAVKLDKEEPFIGKWALERAAAQPQDTLLVGFALDDGRVPTEGSVILNASGSAAGLVTSARRSRQLGRVIGLGWVPAGLAADGSTITIADDGSRLQGSVTTEPFHDPAGELLRS
jgi:sarcosine oxidase, subunit alpha